MADETPDRLAARLGSIIRNGNGLAKSECEVSIECADADAANDLFDLLDALPPSDAGGQKIIDGMRGALLATQIAGEALRNFPPGTVTVERFNEVIAAIAPHVAPPEEPQR